MGLPPLLADTYRRYKKGTGVFLNWLAPTARSTGTVDDIFEGHSSGAAAATTSGRLKGKARKEAKKQPRLYEIPVNAFTKLANAIAAATTIEVPKAMVLILRDVIQSRKACAVFYGNEYKEGAEDTEQDNAGHAHIISVLEDVHATLVARLPRKTRRSLETPTDKTEQLANLFEYLDLEELDESATQHGSPTQPQYSKPSDTYKIKPSNEDITFAIFCFLKDSTDIRLFVRRTWRLFEQDSVTLETAALTMNSAICLMERLNTDFVKIYPQFDEHHAISRYIMENHFTPHMLRQGHMHSTFYTAYTDGDQELSYITVSCDHAEQFLWMFVRDVLTRGICLSKLTFTASEVVLAKCLMQLRTVASAKLPLYERDSIMKAVNVVVETGKTPSWTVFAVQLLWDTQRELGAEIRRGFSSAQDSAQWIFKTLDEYLNLEGAETLGIWHKTNRESIVGLKESAKGLYSYSWEQSFLLRNHPMLCGLLSLDLMERFQSTATVMAGDQGIILNSAHLYNAARQTGLLPEGLKWTDMEWIIEKQSEKHMFVGNRPQAPKFTTHYNLASGESISRLAKDSRSRAQLSQYSHIKVNGNLRRRLRCISMYIEVTLQQIGHNTETTRAHEDGEALLELLLTHSSKDKGMVADKARNKASKHTQKPKMTPVEMLTEFRGILQKDELPLRFDIFKSYLGCLRMLREIQRLVISQAPTDYPGEHHLNELGVNACVSGLLWELDGYPIFDDPQAPQALRILRNFIEKEGDAEYCKALSRVPCISDKDIALSDKEPSFEVPAEDHILFYERDGYKGKKVFLDHGGWMRPVVFDGVFE